MIYKITGNGAIISAKEMAEGVEPAAETIIKINVVIDGRSVDQLLEQYEVYGGYWKSGLFYYFDQEPEITPIEGDLLMRSINAPMLPGLSAY